MTSPARKTPFAPCPVPESVTPATVGTVTSVPLPVTMKSESLVTAVPKPSAALLPAASRIVPEFSMSAEAATLTPSASASAETTA